MTEPRLLAAVPEPGPDDLIGAQLPVATELIMQIRDWDTDGLARMRRCLGPMSDEVWATLVLLGAMVPDTARVGDLLAWVDDEHPPARKDCCRCGRSKPRREFTRDRQRTDGLRPCCRACDLAARRAAA